MARRGHGDGSVYYVENRKKWTGAISLGRDADGNRIRRVVYGDSKKAVQQQLRDLRLRIGTDLKTSQTVRFEDFARGWLQREVAPNRRATTLRFYDLLLRRYIIPQLGKQRIAEVTPTDIERAIAITREMCSPQMALKVRAAISRILNRARRLGLVHANAAAATEPPRVDRKSMRFLDPAQVRALVKAASGERMEALVVLLATAGLRIGEALALTWEDVDLQHGEVRVTKTLIDNTGPLYVAQPKTNAGRRVVVLAQQATDALCRRFDAASAEGFGRETDPVFPTKTGTYQRRKNLTARVFKPLLQRAGLPDIRLHDLRHTSASLSIAAGAHPRTVVERLGHADPGFTMRTYGHSTSDLQREDARNIERLLSEQSATG